MSTFPIWIRLENKQVAVTQMGRSFSTNLVMWMTKSIIEQDISELKPRNFTVYAYDPDQEEMLDNNEFWVRYNIKHGMWDEVAERVIDILLGKNKVEYEEVVI